MTTLRIKLCNNLCSTTRNSRLRLVCGGLLFLSVIGWWWFCHVREMRRGRYAYFQQLRQKNGEDILPTNTAHDAHGQIDRINMAVVACGDLEYFEVLLKSAILFSLDTHLHFILFTDTDTMPRLKQMTQRIQASAEVGIKMESYRGISFELKSTWFPNDGRVNWKWIFKKCSTQRLFIPSLLPDVDSVIYMDTDTLIMGNLSILWSRFFTMDHQQLIAAAPDTRNAYNDKTKFPFSPPTGINAGVLLMNLTRMRLFSFVDKIRDIPSQYGHLDLSDQDLINILLHDHPEIFLALSCSFNFWNGHCVTPEQFYDDELRTEGIFVLHGASRQFPKKRFRPYSLFSNTYNVMKTIDLAEPPTTFLEKLKIKLDTSYLHCSAAVTPEILLRNAVQYFKNLHLINNFVLL